MSLFSDHQRIDLDQRAVLLDKYFIEGRDKLGHLLSQPGIQIQGKDDLVDLKGAQPDTEINTFLDNLFRRCPGQLLDLHPAFPAGNNDGAFVGAIHGNPQVDLPDNVHPFLNQHLVNLLSLGARLRRYQSHTDHGLGDFFHFGRRRGGLDSSALAPTPRMHLRLHDE